RARTSAHHAARRRSLRAAGRDHPAPRPALARPSAAYAEPRRPPRMYRRLGHRAPVLDLSLSIPFWHRPAGTLLAEPMALSRKPVPDRDRDRYAMTILPHSLLVAPRPARWWSAFARYTIG